MQRSVFLFVTAILMGYAPATIAQGPASLPRATPESQGVSSKALQAFIGELHSKVNTMHSVMVVRHGKVIAEAWWTPQTPETRHLLWSLSKSFTSTAVGLAIEIGRAHV